MRANSNANSFFLLILTEKKRVGATSIFSNLSDRDKFLYKMLNFRKTMRFFLGAKYNQVLVTYGNSENYTQ